VYKKYINPDATEEQILRVSHWAVRDAFEPAQLSSDEIQVAFYALVMGIAGLIFYYIGISMGWLYVGLSVFTKR
jgi:hypothetical protein